MPPSRARLLRYSLKAADRGAAAKFLRDALGMTALRHEEGGGEHHGGGEEGGEVEEGEGGGRHRGSALSAGGGGPYAGRWSTTLWGYNDAPKPEDTGFALELVYQ